MGDRVSISFKNGSEESVTLFSHLGGLDFVETARDFVRGLVVKKHARGQGSDARFVLYPQEAMTQLIRHIIETDPDSWEDCYLGKDGDDGDNSDNGHWALDLDEIAARVNEWVAAIRNSLADPPKGT